MLTKKMMLNELEEANGIGKIILNRLRHNGIDTLEKLVSIKVEDLVKINGIGNSTALKLKMFAIDILKEKKFTEKKSNSKNKLKIVKPAVSKDIITKRSLKLEKPVIPKKVESTIPLSNEKTSFFNNNNLIEIEVTPKAIKPQLTGSEETLSNLMKNQISKLPLKSFFSHKTMQKIRFLHYKVKLLENILNRGEEQLKLEELDYIIDYVEILNVNYKNQSHLKIFKDLNISSSFHDPLMDKEIEIWDLMFECTWALWILARIYVSLSQDYELKKDYQNAIIAMVKASKIFKTAAHFSAACTRQEEFGKSLKCEDLELRSEEARILAQCLAAEKEEKENNLFLASKIYSGLSVLSKRLLYLKQHGKIKTSLLTAQFHYDYGMAYFLKAKILGVSANSDEEKQNELELRQKSNFYFSKAEEIWHDLRVNYINLSLDEIKKIDHNLSIVNENIIENDAEVMEFEDLNKVEEIDPFIVIPENIAPFIPRSTSYLTKFKPKHVEFGSYREFKNVKIESTDNVDKMEILKIELATIKRTITELKFLYKNNDIDINKFTELIEKYTLKLKTIENDLKNLREKREKNTQKKEKRLIKTFQMKT